MDLENRVSWQNNAIEFQVHFHGMWNWIRWMTYVYETDDTRLWYVRPEFHRLAHRVCGQPYFPGIQLAIVDLSHVDHVEILTAPLMHHLGHAMFEPPHSNMLLLFRTSSICFFFIPELGKIKMRLINIWSRGNVFYFLVFWSHSYFQTISVILSPNPIFFFLIWRSSVLIPLAKCPHLLFTTILYIDFMQLQVAGRHFQWMYVWKMTWPHENSLPLNGTLYFKITYLIQY